MANRNRLNLGNFLAKTRRFLSVFAIALTPIIGNYALAKVAAPRCPQILDPSVKFYSYPIVKSRALAPARQRDVSYHLNSIESAFSEEETIFSEAAWATFQEALEARLHHLEPKHREAARAVAKSLYEGKNWARWAQSVYVDAAKWTAKKGDDIEIRILKNQGGVSRRAVIAALKARAEKRGEKLGTITSSETEEFRKTLMAGPFIDEYWGADSIHGRFAHLLQMDYIAPTLASFYPSGSSEFYGAIFDCGLWDFLFDQKVSGTIHSPAAVTYILRHELNISD